MFAVQNRVNGKVYNKQLYDGADDAYYESQQPEEKYHQITMDEYLESLQKDGE